MRTAANCNQTFADVLKAEMSARGLLVRELAAKLGVSDMTIQNWRVGRHLPKLPQAIALARLFGCSVESLFPDLCKKEVDAP